MRRIIKNQFLFFVFTGRHYTSGRWCWRGQCTWCVCAGARRAVVVAVLRAAGGGSCAAVRRDGVSPGGYRHRHTQRAMRQPPAGPLHRDEPPATPHASVRSLPAAACTRRSRVIEEPGAPSPAGCSSSGHRHCSTPEGTSTPPPACPVCRDAPTAAPRTALSACGCGGTRPHEGRNLWGGRPFSHAVERTCRRAPRTHCVPQGRCRDVMHPKYRAPRDAVFNTNCHGGTSTTPSAFARRGKMLHQRLFIQ